MKRCLFPFLLSLLVCTGVLCFSLTCAAQKAQKRKLNRDIVVCVLTDESLDKDIHGANYVEERKQMPTIEGAYRLINKIFGYTFTAYEWYNGDEHRSYLSPADVMVLEDLGKLHPEGERLQVLSVKSIDATEIPVKRCYVKRRKMNYDEWQNLKTLLKNHLFKLDSLAGLPQNLRPSLDTLGLNDLQRRLPELHGAMTAYYANNDGVQGIEVFNMEGRTYRKTSTPSFADFFQYTSPDVPLFPWKFDFKSNSTAQYHPATQSIGWEQWEKLETYIAHHLFVSQRISEIRASQGDEYYKIAQYTAHKAFQPQEAKGKQRDEGCKFYGGEQALLSFIARNLKYPSKALSDNTQGIVKVEFYIEPDGSVNAVKVVQHLSEECDLEAMSVVQSLPYFIPAFKDGRPTRCKITLPIRFSIQE